MDLRRVWLGSGPGSRWAHLNEIRKNSLWIVPSIAVVVAIAAAMASLNVDESAALREDGPVFASSPEDARQVVSTIASSMLTFMGVVFSMTLVALQLASTQYSPRVVRSFVRSPVTKWTLAVFLATFTYSFTTLAAFDSGDPAEGVDSFIPATSVSIAFLLVLASLFVFIAFVHTIVRSMRVSYVIRRLADETRAAIAQNFPERPSEPQPPVPELGTPTSIVYYHGRPGVVAGIDVDRLVRLARQHDVVLRFPHLVGVFLERSVVMVEIYGDGTVSERQLRDCLDLGVERTLYLDPAYGIRQLVDIAIRALSPAVNDPTTAVQVIDRLSSVLSEVAGRPRPTGVYLDDGNDLRLVRPILRWDRLVDLAFTEIRHYGADSPQVTRRLVAAFDNLSALIDDNDRVCLAQQRALLESEVVEQVDDPIMRNFGLVADPMGLG